MKMTHVTISTGCLQESVSFYQDVMGLSIQNDFRDTVNLPIVFLGSSPDETSVELIEDKENPYRGEGISIGFQVEDVEVVHQKMEGEGLQPSPIVTPTPTTKFFFIKDPNGVTLQFIKF